MTVALSRLGDALTAEGVQVIFADCCHGSSVETDLEGWAPGVVSTLKLMSNSPFIVIRAMLRLRSLLRDQAVDIVHLHHRRLALLVGLVAKSLRIPIVYTGHLTYSNSRLFALSPLSAVVAISESVMANLQATHSCKNRFLISNVVDFSGGAAQSTRIRPNQACCVARLEPIKNHVTLLRAWALLDPVSHGLRLLLVGEGGDKEKLQKLASDLGISSTVDFLGYRSDVRELISGSLFCLLPSFREGQPLAVIEAASMGRATIVTDVDGSRDCLPPQTTLPNRVNPNSENDLAAAMRTWFGSPDTTIVEGKVFLGYWERKASPTVVASATMQAYFSTKAQP